MTPSERARTFRSLHRKGEPLVLFNIWDAASARAVEEGGAPALATGSHSLAAGLGYPDGETVPFDEAMFVLRRICAVTRVPITHDLERGFADTPDGVRARCKTVMEIGAAGVNIEDTLSDGTLRDTQEQAERLAAAKEAMERVTPGAVLNARCDVFFRKETIPWETGLDAALVRANAYAEAGADCLFLPGLSELDHIREMTDASPLPVNIMRTLTGPAIAELAGAGVARISHGPFPFIAAMAHVQALAREVY